jgi:hypothetical protein
MIEERWFNSWQGQGIFSVLQSVQTSSGAHPASDSMCSWVSLPSSKVAVGEADHTPPSSAVAVGEAITHLSLAQRLRMSGATTPLLHMPSWCTQGELYLYTNNVNTSKSSTTNFMV